jgi:hypothetical protein
MKKIWFAFAIILQSISSFSQVIFQTGYGDTTMESGVSITRTDDGYTFIGIAGENNTDSSDIALFHITTTGELQWSFKTGLNKDEIVSAMVMTSDSGYLITGTTFSSPLDPTHSDIFVCKFSSEGDLQWGKVIGGNNFDEAKSMTKTPEGNYLITGNTKSYGTATISALALKIDETGYVIWCNVNNAAPVTFFNNAAIAGDGKYILAGGADNAGNIDNYVVKMDTNGSIIWGKRYGSAGSEWLNGIQSVAGGFVTAGLSTQSTAGDTDQCIMKIDSAGGIVWANNYGTTEYDRANDVIENSNNHFVVIGTSNFTSIGQMVMEEIDNNGNIVWSNSYGSLSETTTGASLIHGTGVGYAGIGYSVSFGDPHGDVYVVKTDNTGTSGCAENPFTLIKNSPALTVTTGANGQLVVPDSMEIFMNTAAYIDQYAENCFSDKIHEIVNEGLIKLYPNPAISTLQIEADFGKAIATIIDTFGQKVAQHNITAIKSTVDVKALKPGTYFLEIKGENKFARVQFVKQ